MLWGEFLNRLRECFGSLDSLEAASGNVADGPLPFTIIIVILYMNCVSFDSGLISFKSSTRKVGALLRTTLTVVMKRISNLKVTPNVISRCLKTTNGYVHIIMSCAIDVGVF